MVTRNFNNHGKCPIYGVDAYYTLNTGTKKRDAHLKFNGHTGPNDEKVICSQLIVLRGQHGWPWQAERKTQDVRRKEGFE